jgi:hypothetical protein
MSKPSGKTRVSESSKSIVTQRPDITLIGPEGRTIVARGFVASLGNKVVVVTVHAYQAAMILLSIWMAPGKIGGTVSSRLTRSVHATQMLAVEVIVVLERVDNAPTKT